MKYKNLNLKYALINCFYFFLVCGTAGFANNYLQYKGLDTSIIGMLLTLVSVIALIGQTTMAPIVDKSKKWNEKKFIIFTLVVACVAYALMFFIPGESIFTIVLSVIGFAFASIGIPYLNSLAFVYEKEGAKINYGLGRGVGSAAYAVAALCIGQLIKWRDASILPIWLLATAILTIAVVNSLQDPPEEKSVVQQEETKISYVAFFQKYSSILIVVLAMIMLFFTHMLINNYMINIVEEIGGDAGSQGTATFIQALVELPPMFGFALLLKKFHVNQLLAFSAVAWVVKDVLILLAPNMTVYYIAMVFQMFSYAILIPASVYFADENIAPEDRNQGQAIIGAAGTIGGLFASFVGGFLLSILTVRTTLYVGIGVAVVGAVLMLVGIHKLNKK